MAKKNLFNYGTEKRKIGHSKFDMSYNSLSSQNFGSLTVKGLFETLPDDFWSIGENALTKMKPTVAPAFTRIHQNWYAFYVRNQQIWQDWNNYITNGTAWGDVYASNANNQNVSNPWKVPQLSANDIQLPLKIAHGFAIPVFRWQTEPNDTTALYPDFQSFAFQSFNRPSISADPDCSLFFQILNIMYGYDVPYIRASDSSVSNRFYLEFGGSYRQLDPILKVRFRSGRSSEFPDDPNTIGQNTPIFPDTADFLVRDITYRLFSDSVSSDVDLSNSPFYHTKEVSTSSYNGLDLNDYVFHQRRTLNQNMVIGTVSEGQYSYRHYLGFRSPFFGVEFAIRPNGQNSSDVFIVNYHDASSYYYQFILPRSFTGIQYNGSSYVDSSVFAFMDRLPGVLGVTTEYFYDFFDGLGGETQPSGAFSDRILTQNGQTAFDGSTIDVTNIQRHCLGRPFRCDLLLPVTVSSDVFDSSIFTMYSPFMFAPQSHLSDSMGFYSDAWLIYLCKQAAAHIDSMNLPVDALTVRSTQAYRYEFFNALPFFAYSKIWNDHFRNKALSSPELDYSYANGYAVFDATRRSFLAFTQERPAVLPEAFKNTTIATMPTNGWCIPMCVLPKNSIPEDYTELDGFRHFITSKDHYFNVSSYYTLFSLLTGASLETLTLYQQFNSFTAHHNISGEVDYRTFSDLYASKFYLPSYYNGLLHTRYQNFNKDYFTSGLLDPMSGANQVELGHTVNELRVNETKQSWYEKIVNARSISGFMRAIFGIDPIVDESESRMLGSDHIDVNIGEVIQTSESGATPQGNRSGLGQAHGQGSLAHSHCNEHGWILIICSHTLESQYQQGLEKHWIPKASYMDYPTVDFQSIGNESILQKEINYTVEPHEHFKYYEFDKSYFWHESQEINGSKVTDKKSKVKYKAQGNPILQETFSPQGQASFNLTRNIARSAGTSLDNVFAFNMRYSTYKFKLDQVHGEMRNRLKYWQTFRKFFGQPVLSHEFINWELLADSEELNRIFAVTEDEYDDKFLLDVFINASVDRALSYISVPHS